MSETTVVADDLENAGPAPRERGFGTGLIIAGSLVLAVVVLGRVFAGLITAWGPTDIDSANNLTGPGGSHLLGTDSNGMDIWSRLLYSIPTDLGIAVASVVLAVVIGSLVGLVVGYRGGWLDEIAMRLVDILQSFPSFILALAVAALTGAGTLNLIIVLAVVNAPAYARLIRTEVRGVRELPYIEAARTSGGSTWQILLRHVLPNSIAPIRVIAPLNCGWAMLSLAGLSFVGLGVPVPNPEWGAMISLGTADVVAGRWWTSLPAGLALLACVLAFSMIGEGLQERATRSGS